MVADFVLPNGYHVKIGPEAIWVREGGRARRVDYIVSRAGRTIRIGELDDAAELCEVVARAVCEAGGGMALVPVVGKVNGDAPPPCR